MSTTVHDDIDAWIDGSLRASEAVEVYAKAGLKGEIQKLDAELRALPSTRERDRRALAKRIEALRAEMAASRRTFTLTALTEDRHRALIEEHEDDESNVELAFHVLGEQLEPTLTTEQMHRLAEHLGGAYFAQVFLAASHRVQQGIAVSVPFSSTASSILST